MNLGDMKSRLLRMLGNLPSADIHVVANEHIDWLNDGVRDVVIEAIVLRENFNLFPELNTSWTTTATTVDGDNDLDVPDDKYAITGLASYDTDDAVTLAADRLYPMERISRQDFDLLDKTVKDDYPKLWCWFANKALIWPTPDTDHLTYIEMYGLMRDQVFTSASSDSASYRINEIWHDAIVKRAAYHGAMAKGWFDRAGIYRDAVTAILRGSADVTALSFGGQKNVVEVEWFTRGDVHGT